VLLHQNAAARVTHRIDLEPGRFVEMMVRALRQDEHLLHTDKQWEHLRDRSTAGNTPQCYGRVLNRDAAGILGVHAATRTTLQDIM